MIKDIMVRFHARPRFYINEFENEEVRIKGMLFSITQMRFIDTGEEQGYAPTKNVVMAWLEFNENGEMELSGALLPFKKFALEAIREAKEEVMRRNNS
jgi:hypothetical protein